MQCLFSQYINITCDDNDREYFSHLSLYLLSTDRASLLLVIVLSVYDETDNFFDDIKQKIHAPGWARTTSLPVNSRTR